MTGRPGSTSPTAPTQKERPTSPPMTLEEFLNTAVSDIPEELRDPTLQILRILRATPQRTNTSVYLYPPETTVYKPGKFDNFRVHQFEDSPNEVTIFLPESQQYKNQYFNARTISVAQLPSNAIRYTIMVNYDRSVDVPISWLDIIENIQNPTPELLDPTQMDEATIEQLVQNLDKNHLKTLIAQFQKFQKDVQAANYLDDSMKANYLQIAQNILQKIEPGQAGDEPTPSSKPSTEPEPAQSHPPHPLHDETDTAAISEQAPPSPPEMDPAARLLAAAQIIARKLKEETIPKVLADQQAARADREAGAHAFGFIKHYSILDPISKEVFTYVAKIPAEPEGRQRQITEKAKINIQIEYHMMRLYRTMWHKLFGDYPCPIPQAELIWVEETPVLITEFIPHQIEDIQLTNYRGEIQAKNVPPEYQASYIEMRRIQDMMKIALTGLMWASIVTLTGQFLLDLRIRQGEWRVFDPKDPSTLQIIDYGISVFSDHPSDFQMLWRSLSHMILEQPLYHRYAKLINPAPFITITETLATTVDLNVLQKPELTRILPLPREIAFWTAFRFVKIMEQVVQVVDVLTELTASGDLTYSNFETVLSKKGINIETWYLTGGASLTRRIIVELIASDKLPQRAFIIARRIETHKPVPERDYLRELEFYLGSFVEKWLRKGDAAFRQSLQNERKLHPSVLLPYKDNFIPLLANLSILDGSANSEAAHNQQRFIVDLFLIELTRRLIRTEHEHRQEANHDPRLAKKRDYYAEADSLKKHLEHIRREVRLFGQSPPITGPHIARALDYSIKPLERNQKHNPDNCLVCKYGREVWNEMMDELIIAYASAKPLAHLFGANDNQIPIPDAQVVRKLAIQLEVFAQQGYTQLQDHRSMEDKKREKNLELIQTAQDLATRLKQENT